jgi:hypothetical protein
LESVSCEHFRGIISLAILTTIIDAIAARRFLVPVSQGSEK